MTFHTRPDWQNIEVQSINRFPAHAPWGAYETLEQAITCDRNSSKYVLSLDGTWRFLLVDHPDNAPADFYLPEYDLSNWQGIHVPGNWEAQGFSAPIYTNWVYPFRDDAGPHIIEPSKNGKWDSTSRMNPPYVPNENPTGLYVRAFELPNGYIGRKMVLSFGGVESGFYLWVNGTPVGYSQDSKLMAEFDITELICEGKNTIALKVICFTDATWLEDQDYWHISGIFRSVKLFAKPHIHILDSKVTATADGKLICDVQIPRVEGFAEYQMKMHLFDENGQSVFEDQKEITATPTYFANAGAEPGWAQFETTIENAKKWTPEMPNLYTAVFTLLNSDGVEIDHESTKVGFRTVKIVDGVILLNGVRMIFRGVNRHEHAFPTGRTVSKTHIVREIELMKSLNFNAVRTCHYPNDPTWYELCDEMGIAVVCETNLETHGVRAMLSRDPEWAEAYLQRARRMVLIHKNHPCIVSWSLGNESGHGANHAAMAGWIRHYDKSRMVQYESGAPGADISDIRCPMYAPETVIINMLTDAKDIRPIVLCEYTYQISNTGGGMYKYRELTERFERFQGGFVWDWQDKAMAQRDEKGNLFAGYGGDFGEDVVEKHEPKFMCMNGVVTHDLLLKPSALETAMAQAPVFLKQSPINHWGPANEKEGKFTICNRHHAHATSGMTMHWMMIEDGTQVAAGDVDLPTIAAMNDKVVQINLPEERKIGKEYFLNVDIIRAEKLINRQQFMLNGKGAAKVLQLGYKKAELKTELEKFIIEGDDFTLVIDRNTGLLTSCMKGGKQYFIIGLMECLSRGITGADVQLGWGVWKDWTAFTEENSSRTLISLTASMLADGRVLVERVTRMESTVVAGATVDTIMQMKVAGVGKIELSMRFAFDNMVKSLPRLGFEWTLPEGFDAVEWYGNGPGESYSDREMSTPVGTYQALVKDMHFPFVPPSENGGRDNVRTLSLAAKDGRKILITGDQPFHFDAHDYTVSQLRCAKHEHELQHNAETTLHIDAAHAGIGGDMAWSTMLCDKHKVLPGAHSLIIAIELK